MTTRTWVLAGAGVALVAAASGLGYAAATGDGADAIDFCERTDSQVVVGYTYGSGDTVETSFEQSPGQVTVSVRTTPPDGPRIAVGLMDEVTFPLRDSDAKIVGDAGRSLDCTRVEPDEQGRMSEADRAAVADEEAALTGSSDEQLVTQ